MEGVSDHNTAYEGATDTWPSDPDLLAINEQRPAPPELRVSQGDIEKVWQNLMLLLCRRYRINKRGGRQTDYRIEDLRNDHYRAFTDARYFRRLVGQLARQHEEIEIERDIIRITDYGLNNCKKYDPTFQKDFE